MTAVVSSRTLALRATWRLLAMERERALAAFGNAFAGSDSASRGRAARTILTATLLIGGIAWTLARLVTGSAVAEVRTSVHDDTSRLVSFGVASLIACLLAIDGIRRGSGLFESDWERRFSDEWLRANSVPTVAIAVRGTLRTILGAVCIGWIVLVPLMPFVGELPTLHKLMLGLFGTVFVLLGDTIGQRLRHARMPLRIVAIVMISASVVTMIGFLVALDPATFPVFQWFRYLTAAVTLWQIVIDRISGPAVITLLLTASIGLTIYAHTWTTNQLGWRDSSPDIRRAQQPIAARFVTLGRERVWMSLLRHDTGRIATWLASDVLIVLLIAVPTLLLYTALPWVPVKTIALLTSPSVLPWLVLYILALPALAYGEGMWGKESPQIWGLYRMSLPSPDRAIWTRMSVLVGGLVALNGVLSLLLAVAVGLTRPVFMHAVLGTLLSFSAGSMSTAAGIVVVRMGAYMTVFARLMRYTAVGAGVLAPTAVYAATGSLVWASVATAIMTSLAISTARRQFRRMEFVTQQ